MQRNTARTSYSSSDVISSYAADQRKVNPHTPKLLTSILHEIACLRDSTRAMCANYCIYSPTLLVWCVLQSFTNFVHFSKQKIKKKQKVKLVFPFFRHHIFCQFKCISWYFAKKFPTTNYILLFFIIVSNTFLKSISHSFAFVANISLFSLSSVFSFATFLNISIFI